MTQGEQDAYIQVVINVNGPAEVAETTELQDWLHESRIKDINSIIREEQPPNAGEQGPTLLAVLTIVLNSRALVALFQSIGRYIEAANPKTKICVKYGKKSIEIDCKRPPPLPELAAAARELLSN